MNPTKRHIITINGGSSNIKFAMYETENMLQQLFSGSIENIDAEDTRFSHINNINGDQISTAIEINGFEEAANYLLDWLELQSEFTAVTAIGHFLVHGMQHTKAEKISAKLLSELKQIHLYGPDQVLNEIMLIELSADRHPSFIQVACFDSVIHTKMPHVGKELPIAGKHFDMGNKPHDFHDVSSAYLIRELENIAGSTAANGKIILAQLGNDASIAAFQYGEGVDTGMTNTPLSEPVTGTRREYLDYVAARYLLPIEKLTLQPSNHLGNTQSGSPGIPAKSGDMRDIIENKNADPTAAKAFELFCYQTKKSIGAYAAGMEGLDTLIFSGCMGEHSPEVRSQVCDGLEFIGIEMDEIKNMNNETIVSSATSKVTVRVIQTNEQLMIAKLVCDVLNELT